VEGALGAGFTNRLRRDDADGLADIDDVAASKIAPVTGRTHAVAGLTGNRGTDFHLVNAHLV